MPKMTKAKLASMGSKIMAEAKRIRRAHPGKKWTTCVSEAGRKFRS